MATVTSYTKEKIDELTDGAFTGGYIDASGNIVLVAQDTTEVIVGAIMDGVLEASDTVAGVSEYATDEEAIAGTGTHRIVTPANLAAVLSGALATIRGLSPSNDDILQLKSGAWANRTIAQLATDLSSKFPTVFLHNGTSYVEVAGDIYVGSVDPGSVANGCVWFDTTGV